MMTCRETGVGAEATSAGEEYMHALVPGHHTRTCMHVNVSSY